MNYIHFYSAKQNYDGTFSGFFGLKTSWHKIVWKEKVKIKRLDIATAFTDGRQALEDYFQESKEISKKLREVFYESKK